MKPTVQAKEAIGELGLSLFNEKTLASEGGLFKVLKQLNEKAGDSVGTLGSVIPNIRALTGALAAAGQQKDVPDILNQISNASGNTDIALTKMTDTFAFKWEKLIAQIDSLKTRFGEIVASSDVLRGAMEKVSIAIEGVMTSIADGGAGFEGLRNAIDNFLVHTIPAAIRGFADMLSVAGTIAIELVKIFDHPIFGGEGNWLFPSLTVVETEHSFIIGKIQTNQEIMAERFEGSIGRMSASLNEMADSVQENGLASIAAAANQRQFAEAVDSISEAGEKALAPFSILTDVWSGLQKSQSADEVVMTKTTSTMGQGAKSTEASAKAWSSFEDNVNAAASTITKAGGMIPAISETAKAIETAVWQVDNLKHQFLGTVTAAMNLRGIADGLGAAFGNSMTPALEAVSTWLDDLFDRLGEWGTELGTTLQDAVAGWYTTKHELEVLDAARSQDIHAASASSAAAITNSAIAQIMPSLSAAATAALIATQGGAQVHAGLLPALLAAAAAQGAAFAAFADGGRVTSPTLALISEAGDETIIPETRTGRARDVLSDLASRRPELFAGGSQGSSGNVTSNTINVSVSGGGGDEGIAERIADEVDRILGRRIS